jgi:hypothetical protein
MLAQCGACAIVFDGERADRVPEGSDVASLRWRIAVDSDAAPAGATALQQLGTHVPGLGHAVDVTPSRHRRHPLHLGHDRLAPRRDAEPPQHRPFGAPLRRLHAARARRPRLARSAG